MKIVGFCSIVCIVLLSFSTHAQLPELINYQGRLADGGGLVNGNKTLVFRLFSNDVGGVEGYAESQTVTVLDGLYSTMIGASNSIPGSLTAALSMQPCWLEIEVEGTPLTPRERLVCVPFAMSANEADPLWSAEKSAYATGTPLYAYSESDPLWNAEKAAFATGTPLYTYTETDPVWTLEKSAYATGTPLYTESDPSGTNHVRKTGDTMTGMLVLPANGLRVGASDLIVSTGGVGIGTISPGHILHLKDTVADTNGTEGTFIDVQNDSIVNGVISGIRFCNGNWGTPDAAHKGALFYHDSSGYNRGDLIFANNRSVDTASASTADACMIIYNAGHVGIMYDLNVGNNLTVAGTNLSVAGNVKAEKYLLSNNAWLQIDASGTNLLFIANSVTNRVGLTPQ